MTRSITDMRNRELSLITVLLIPVFSFSQAIYPKVLVPGDRVQDTIVALTIPQMDSVNRTFSWNEQLHGINDSLLIRIDSCQRAFHLFHHSDSIQEVQLSLSSKSIHDRDSVIALQSDAIHHRDQQITRLKHRQSIITATGVAVSAFLMYLLFR